MAEKSFALSAALYRGAARLVALSIGAASTLYVLVRRFAQVLFPDLAFLNPGE